MTTKPSKFNCIDLTKFIMAIFVVAIHTSPLINCKSHMVTTIWSCIFNCAVPFFFISSGFLLAHKADDAIPSISTQIIVQKHLKKIIKLYVFWSVIYMPLAIYNLDGLNCSPVKSIILYLRGFFIVGENYNSWMLWYLLSTIYTLVSVILLLKLHLNLKHITFLGGAVFLLGNVITEFVGYTGDLPHFLSLCQKILSKTIVSGRILTGFFYIPLGMLLTKKRIPLRFGIVLALCGFICNVFFDGLIGEVMLAVCAVGIFVIVSNIELKESAIYPILRKISTVIYFIHMYVWTVYYSLVYHEKTFGFDSFIVTTSISIVIALVQVFLNRSMSLNKNPSK